MKIVHFSLAGKPGWGVLTEPTRLTPMSPDLAPEEVFRLAAEHPEQLLADGLPNSIDVGSIQWLPPALPSSKLICIGKNYADHAKEMGGEAPELPIVFSKFASCLIGHRQPIILPEISSQVDWEAELVVAIGRRGRNIPESTALDWVAGYCCGNDVSARDWQKGRPGGQWLLGKTFDTFGPLGPFLVSRNEVPDPHQLQIELRLNGEPMQRASTSQLIYRIEYLIAHLSRFVTLEPGDLIFTGTPAGVGAGRTPPRYLQAGEEIEIEITGLGKLKNRVVAAE
jgi:2-keto-4-pentenoate hydratase/2-oxohepta-3-ene-1,7-dioic acid hydratase in catechol pathway